MSQITRSRIGSGIRGKTKLHALYDLCADLRPLGTFPASMRFVVLSKTDWSEPPRLRHHVAMLLATAGHDVLFVQRARYPWQRRTREESGAKGVELAQLNQLIHHRLRLFPCLHWLNAHFETRELRSLARSRSIGATDVILNFNYDYFFLREAFPGNRIISIINDAHWVRRNGHERKRQLWALRRTLHASDACLTVSDPLRQRLSSYRPTEIFRPWATSEYRTPHRDEAPTELLYWGYINKRLDFDFIEELAVDLAVSRPDLRLVFTGPVRCRSRALRPLRARSNVVFRPPTPFHELDFRNTRAGIIPFKRQGCASIDACEIPSKFFMLVSRGLPVLITGMPNFYRAPFVFRLDAAGTSPVDVIDQAWRAMPDLEEPMRRCVARNSACIRLSQLLSVIDDLAR